ncbi:Inner membrane ABC transporter permease protein ycjO [Acholeplasma oculi]|uniref:ABC transporter, permease protein n=1 Tax=Acholeplasma oculi TaxID=35623 RepID=A0A061AJV2_9MOLU|nr:sugar ABC transporter permease [Acholeplasma oculi]CDR31262.1 ABC transporter, permease protein [Acholeplasma oculi]SKC38485.1 carbohydrate ABC transporter membrane protein 1, CUT1 family [Acholeplasma oculi]SUT91394.1 Inner membrane ABC transporter permease protein ycjO [Acholeplasma oculi]
MQETIKLDFKTRSKLIWKEMKEHKHHYILMAPYLILFLLFTVIPVVMSLGISFTQFNMLETPRFVGLDNYIKLLLDDEVFIIAIRNTLILAVVTGPVSYLLAFVFAWLINELKPKLRAFMTLIFYAPSISGNAFLIWLLIFSGDAQGYANGFLMQFGFINNPILWLRDPDYMLFVVILVQLWLSLGVSFLAFIAGLQGVDKTLYEAGSIDGIKNRWQELWFITIPSMKPQLLFGAVMQITTSLAIAEVSMQLVGFPSVQYEGHTIVTHLIDYGSIRFDLGYASAIATVLFIIMITANLVVQKFLRRMGE